VFRHPPHYAWIPNNQTDEAWHPSRFALVDYVAVVKAKEFNETRRANRRTHYLINFRNRVRLENASPEFFHVWMANARVQHLKNFAKRL
jgi:hypothetical protein